MKKRVVTTLALVAALVLAPVSGHLTSMAVDAQENAENGIMTITGGNPDGGASGNTPTPSETPSGGNPTPVPPTPSETPSGGDPTPVPTPGGSATPAPGGKPTPGPGGTATPAPGATATPAPDDNNNDSNDNNNNNNNNNNNSDSTPSATATPAPVVVGADGMYENVQVKWVETTAVVNAAIARAAAQGTIQNVDIIIGKTVNVPTSVLTQIAGNNVTLALHVGRGLALTITGTDIVGTNASFNVSLVTSTIPAAAKASVAENAISTRDFSFNQDGAFPFHVNMHMNFGTENVGKTAVLYRFDAATGKMVQVGTFIVNADGQAMFGLNQGGQYVAVVVEVVEPSTYTVQPGDTFGRIASRHGMSAAELKAANPGIRNINKIKVGQVLNVK